MEAIHIFVDTARGLNWKEPRAWAYLLREFWMMLKTLVRGDDNG